MPLIKAIKVILYSITLLLVMTLIIAFGLPAAVPVWAVANTTAAVMIISEYGEDEDVKR
jgi:hypothetical protein